jgi:hypothetical protein
LSKPIVEDFPAIAAELKKLQIERDKNRNKDIPKRKAQPVVDTEDYEYIGSFSHQLRDWDWGVDMESE